MLAFCLLVLVDLLVLSQWALGLYVEIDFQINGVPSGEESGVWIPGIVMLAGLTAVVSAATWVVGKRMLASLRGC